MAIDGGHAATTWQRRSTCASRQEVDPTCSLIGDDERFMAVKNGVAVCTSVLRPRTIARPAAPRVSDRGLFALKMMLMAVGLGALLCASQVRAAQAWAPLTNEWQGHSIRYPKDWWAKKEGIRLATVISEIKADHMAISPALAPAPRGIQVRLERVTAAELNVPLPIHQEALVRAAARYIRIQSADAVRKTALMGRPAIELSGPRPGGWGAVIVIEEGGFFVLLQIAAPSQFALERASRTWRAIAASARPAPARSYADLEYPPADPSDPGWGPGEEAPR
jgi:hypothetical protein